MIYTCYTDKDDITHVICNDPLYKPSKISSPSSVIAWTYGEFINGTKVLALTTLDTRTIVSLFTLDGKLAANIDVGFNILSLDISDDQLFIVSDNNEVFIYGYITSFTQKAIIDSTYVSTWGVDWTPK